MNTKQLSLSAILGVSLLTLGLVGINHVDARHLTQNDWKNLSYQQRQQRLEQWKAKHPRRTKVMQQLLHYLELDETGIEELKQTGTPLNVYIQDNGYDMETVKAILREGMIAYLDELRHNNDIEDNEYFERYQVIDDRIEKALYRVGPAARDNWETEA